MDQDSKFMSSLMNHLFKKVNIKLRLWHLTIIALQANMA